MTEILIVMVNFECLAMDVSLSHSLKKNVFELVFILDEAGKSRALKFDINRIFFY